MTVKAQKRAKAVAVKPARKVKAAPQAAESQAFNSTAWEARGTDILGAMREAAARSAASAGGGGAAFIKLDQKSNRLRVAQDPNDLSKAWVVMFRQHRGSTPDDKFTTWVDLGWIVQGENAFGSLAGALSTEDLEKIAQYGDPAGTIAKAVREAVGGKLDDLPKDLRDAKYRPFSERRAFFTAVQNGQPGVLEVGATLYDSIMSLFEQSPEAFLVEGGYDLGIGTNGQAGFKKRYTGVSVVPGKPSTVEYTGSFPDLHGVLKKRVPTFRQKAEFAARNYAKFMAFADLTKKDIGL